VTNTFHQHDDFLADLQSMRVALEARKDALRASLRTTDTEESAKLRQEVLALRELIMTIGESLWGEMQSDAAAAAPAHPHNRPAE
jgi:hypothetical protein